MIINSLSMRNFQCYFGGHDKNYFEFGDGLNLVIGDNGGGKSKFFDAFYWVLYDQIFNSDRREFLGTKIYKENLISDKAKKECSLQQRVEAEVILNAKDSREVIYKFTRVYGLKKIDEKEWSPDAGSTLMIEEYKSYKWKIIDPSLHEGILRRLIQPHMQPYMWFQGEQVDSLMDFRDKSTLVNAINILSNITIYDDLIDVAIDAQKKSDTRYIKEQKKLITDKGKADDLQQRLEKYDKDISQTVDQVENYEANLEEAKLNIAELIGQIDDAKKRAELKKEVDELDQRVNKTGKELEVELSSINKRIFGENWLLRNSSEILDRFSKKYKEYINHHTMTLNAATLSESKLPVDIPQPVHVDNMLSDEMCYVCGREAKNGTPEYKHIQSLLERKAKPNDVFRVDCDEYFRGVYENALKCNRDSETIDIRIQETFNKISELKSSISKDKSRIDEIKKSFEYLLEHDRSDDVVSAFRAHESNRDKYQGLLNSSQINLKRLIEEREAIVQKLNKMTVGDLDALTVLTKKIFGQIREVTESTKSGVFQGLIKELQDEANDLFIQMTKNNDAITGDILIRKLGKDSYVPEIVDNEGNIMTGLNDSNIILVKISLIMAIILSRGQYSENFSLILDAPTSKMAENYTYGFYQTLGYKFKQSIVATYDFSSSLDQIKERLTDVPIGSIYSLKPMYPGGDKTDRSDLYVDVMRVAL